MNRKRIYAQLKNGKLLQTFYSVSEEVSYTVRIQSTEERFQLHTYHFDGNDVADDASYKDEKIRNFDTLDALLETVQHEFPGIDLNTL
jgi:hypothetical protein